MAKTKISAAHRAAAREQAETLRRAGVECTDKEVLLAGLIANALETTVTLCSVGTKDLPARPELDTEAARKMFDIKANGDGATAVRCLTMARAIIRARSPAASLEKQANHIAQGLVELFASFEVEAPMGEAPDGG